MEYEGFVSLFIGNSDSSKELDNYVLEGYTEDGDFLPSKFEKDFNINYHNEDFREVEFYLEPSDDLSVLLKSFSYDDKIIPRFVETCGKHLNHKSNSVILLYNYKYDGSVIVANRFRFLATVKYR